MSGDASTTEEGHYEGTAHPSISVSPVLIHEELNWLDLHVLRISAQ